MDLNLLSNNFIFKFISMRVCIENRRFKFKAKKEKATKSNHLPLKRRVKKLSELVNKRLV